MLNILLLLALAAGAQAPVPKPTAEAPVPVPDQTASPSGYTYNAEGRRDPFVSLVGRGDDPKAAGAKGLGLPGLPVSEVSVKGIMLGPAGFIAMLQAAEGKTYIVHGGDRLQDGAVKSIAKDYVVFSQDADGRVMRPAQRDIVKRVRPSDKPGSPDEHMPKERQ